MPASMPDWKRGCSIGAASSHVGTSTSAKVPGWHWPAARRSPARAFAGAAVVRDAGMIFRKIKLKLYEV